MTKISCFSITNNKLSKKIKKTISFTIKKNKTLKNKLKEVKDLCTGNYTPLMRGNERKLINGDACCVHGLKT